MRKDPNRTAYIALVAGLSGKRWIIATDKMKAGQIIKTFGLIPDIPMIGVEGNSYKIGAVSLGL